jgi:hypothetical protein
VSKPGDEHPQFDDLDDLASLGDDMALSDLPDLDPFGDLPNLPEATDTAGATATAEVAPASTKVAAEPEANAETKADAEKDAKTEEDNKKLPAWIDWATVGGVTVLFLLLAIFGIFSYVTVIYVTAVAFVGFAFWRGRETNNIYVILLGCALIAIITAVYCLCLELNAYDFKVKAKWRADVTCPTAATRVA